ncbi:thiamine phosphate synthase, partial [bacterium]|nr:thiamine phosphate synthase [bacterium]
AHSLDEISFNAGLGADYCWYSPIFPTEKGGVVLDGLGAQAVTSALVTAVALGRKDVPFPVVMLGGINLENIGEIVKRGVRRVAAIGALIGAPSVREAARAMKNALSADESFDLKE